jgi:hypothetical protein
MVPKADGSGQLSPKVVAGGFAVPHGEAAVVTVTGVLGADSVPQHSAVTVYEYDVAGARNINCT